MSMASGTGSAIPFPSPDDLRIIRAKIKPEWSIER